MNSFLVDSSVLLRTLQVRSPQYQAACRALELLSQNGHDLFIVPQNLVELWVVATRPSEQNGLGLTAAQASTELEKIKALFVLLPETPAIFPTWETLVRQHSVIGKPAHDARLVAAMHVHGLTGIVTFDKTGFSRFPGIVVVRPEDVKPSASTHLQS
ncbi:MAG: type II toxin-antitoxin system VapC family toxin [Bryobacteraceae bacterium]